MGIRQWSASERPREKLQMMGAHSLSDAELLAILLRVGIQGCDVLSLAHGLLQHFGSLRGVLMANQADLLAYKGMGPAAFCQFAVVLEIGKRVLTEKQQRMVVHNANDVLPLLQMQLCTETVEVLWAVWLDSDNRVLAWEEVSRGSLSHHVVYPRELVKRALACHAAAVILAHNHPSGCVSVSQQDKDATEVLQAALRLLDIVLLDHLVIAGQEHVSVLYG